MPAGGLGALAAVEIAGPGRGGGVAVELAGVGEDGGRRGGGGKKAATVDALARRSSGDP